MMDKSLWMLRIGLLCFLTQGSVPNGFAQKPIEQSESNINLEGTTISSGVGFVHSNGASGQYHIVETVVGGLALFDFDADGWIDIFLPNSAALPGAARTENKTSKLYRNRGDWTFQDVTREAGLDDFDYAMGVTVGDYDNDGLPDMYISNFGPNRLYHNNGDGTFSELTEVAQVGCGKHVGAGVSFLDIEGDGDLDLYVSNYIIFDFAAHKIKNIGQQKFHAGPADFPPASPQLFLNNGDGTFVDISKKSGIASVPGYGMGVVAADFDQDGDADIFVCNDGMANFYFENDGRGNFLEKAVEKGLAFDGSGRANSNMGVDCGDFNNDGLLDLFSTSYQSEMPILYRNRDGQFFVDVTNTAKIDRRLFSHVTWGIGLVDFDNDGDRDLFIACGHFMENIATIDDRTQYRVQNALLSNQGDGTFRETTQQNGTGMKVVESSRGAAFDDLDNDGDIDIVVLNVNAPPTIHRNQTIDQGHWTQVRLIGVESNRDGVGSEVRIFHQQKMQVAQVHSGRGYQSHFGQRLGFGLGKSSQLERIEVRWSSGKLEQFQNLQADRCITLVEGLGQRLDEPNQTR